MDFSTAICDAQGRVVAQGSACRCTWERSPRPWTRSCRFGDDIGTGDVFVFNDPDEGGMHLPDIFVFTPVFADRLVGFAAVSPTRPTSAVASPGAMRSTPPRSSRKGFRSRRSLSVAGRLNETLMAILLATSGSRGPSRGRRGAAGGLPHRRRRLCSTWSPTGVRDERARRSNPRLQREARPPKISALPDGGRLRGPPR